MQASARLAQAGWNDTQRLPPADACTSDTIDLVHFSLCLNHRTEFKNGMPKLRERRRAHGIFNHSRMSNFRRAFDPRSFGIAKDTGGQGPYIGAQRAQDRGNQSPASVTENSWTDASVLILGESGTGKELIARALHDRSNCPPRALVNVNCASIPRELFESEFFGHAKGSFTGAPRDRVEGQFERVGEDCTRQVSVRVIAATNRNLEEEVEAGRFRPDLSFQLPLP